MNRPGTKRMAAGVAVVAAVLAAPATATAAVFNVNTTADHAADGCTTAANGCTLRDAMTDANANGTGADTINLPAAAADYAITAGPLPPIATNLDIAGAGAASTIIDANGAVNVLDIFQTNIGGGTPITISFHDVTVQGSTSGSGVVFIGNDPAHVLNVVRSVIRNNDSGSQGGGVLAVGMGLTNVNESTIANNRANGAVGGGLQVSGAMNLTVSRSTIANNTGNRGVGIMIGGDGFYSTATTIDIRSSTISGNIAAFGPVIIDQETGPSIAKFSYNTIAGNTAAPGSSVLFRNSNAGGGETFKGNIITGNTGTPCSFVTPASLPATEGFNFDDGTTCKFTSPNDHQNTPVSLGALADNGGTTFTHALLAGSPAIDAGGLGGCSAIDGTALSSDQRGSARPQGPACDSGAFELVFPPANTIAPAITGTPAVGQVLTCSQGIWSGAIPQSYAFAWRRDGTAIAGATSTAYTVVAADAGHVLTCHVTATNAAGGAAADSAPTTIQAGGAPTTIQAGGSAAADTTPPRFSSVSLTNKVFAVDPRATAETPASSKAVQFGTSFRYSLSEDARVLVTIQQARLGRIVRRVCRKQGRKNRREKNCTLYTRVGTFAVDAPAGRSTHRFSGRIGSRRLTAGSYRAVLLATDSAGNRSKPTTVTFKVVRR